METNGTDRGKFLTWFLLGAFWGALAGILFAPKPGKELRSDLKQRGTQAMEKTRQISSEAQTKTKEIFEDVRTLAQKVVTRKQAEPEGETNPPA